MDRPSRLKTTWVRHAMCTKNMTRYLAKEFSSDEVRKAIIDMGDDKALGLDGLLALFFQENRNKVDESSINFAKEIWRDN